MIHVIDLSLLLEPLGPSESSLMEVEVPIIDSEECGDAYGPQPITDNMLCAGYPEGGSGSCQVSRGGPDTIA